MKQNILLWSLLIFLLFPALLFGDDKKADQPQQWKKFKKSIQDDLDGLAKMLLGLEDGLKKNVKALKKTHRQQLSVLKTKLAHLQKGLAQYKKQTSEEMQSLKHRVDQLEKKVKFLNRYKKTLALLEKYPQALEALLKEKQRELRERKKIALRKKKLAKKGFVFLRVKTSRERGQKIEEYRHLKTGLEFVLIPQGKYYVAGKMIALKAFLLAKTEVTQKVWRQVMVTRPWKGQKFVRSGPVYPAVYLSWKEAGEFCRRTGLRLPTSAEWEAACRAGTKTKYFWGNRLDPSYVWYKKNAEARGKAYPQKVATLWPNGFGLYDMSGNVWEWCAGQGADPKTKKMYSICRGGSWGSKADICTSSSQRIIPSDVRISELGFRPAFSVD